MKHPKTIDDVITFNPGFAVFCWDVETPNDGVISTGSEDRARDLAAEYWPSLLHDEVRDV